MRVESRARGRCRCAGAGRRRTRAGSDSRARGAGRRAPAARARAASASLAPARRCSRSGAPTICPTRLRGFERRLRILEDHLQLAAHRRSARRAGVRDVLAAEADRARRSASTSRSDRARERRLAAAGLADEPERLPLVRASARRRRRRARRRPCGRTAAPRLIGKCTTRCSTSSSGVRSPSSRSAARRLLPALPGRSGRRPARFARFSSTRQPAAVAVLGAPRRAPPAAAARAHCVERVRAARAEAAALRRVGERRRRARRSPAGARARRGRRARSSRAGPTCTDAAGRRRARRACPARRSGPAYMTATRSATSATTPRSCVIRITPAPVSSRSR